MVKSESNPICLGNPKN